MVLLAVELGSESGPGVLHLLCALCAYLHPGLQFADDAVSCQSGSLCFGHTAPKQIVLAGQPVCSAALRCAALRSQFCPAIPEWMLGFKLPSWCILLLEHKTNLLTLHFSMLDHVTHSLHSTYAHMSEMLFKREFVL